MINQTALDLEAKLNMHNETIIDIYDKYNNNSVNFNQTLAVNHDQCSGTVAKKKQKFVTTNFFYIILYYNEMNITIKMKEYDLTLR